MGFVKPMNFTIMYGKRYSNNYGGCGNIVYAIIFIAMVWFAGCAKGGPLVATLSILVLAGIIAFIILVVVIITSILNSKKKHDSIQDVHIDEKIKDITHETDNTLHQGTIRETSCMANDTIENINSFNSMNVNFNVKEVQPNYDIYPCMISMPSDAKKDNPVKVYENTYKDNQSEDQYIVPVEPLLDGEIIQTEDIPEEHDIQPKDLQEEKSTEVIDVSKETVDFCDDACARMTKNSTENIPNESHMINRVLIEEKDEQLQEDTIKNISMATKKENIRRDEFDRRVRGEIKSKPALLIEEKKNTTENSCISETLTIKNEFAVMPDYIMNFKNELINLEEKTFINYWKYFKDFIHYMVSIYGHIPTPEELNTTNENDIRNYLIFEVKKSDNSGSRNKRSTGLRMTVLRRFFSYLENEKIIESNPMDGFHYYFNWQLEVNGNKYKYIDVVRNTDKKKSEENIIDSHIDKILYDASNRTVSSKDYSYYQIKANDICSKMPNYVAGFYGSMQGMKNSTKYLYVQCLKKYIFYLSGVNGCYMDKIDFRKINEEDIEEYVAFLEKKASNQNGRGLNGIKGQLAAIKKFYAYLVDEDIVKINPVSSIEYPRKRKLEEVSLDTHERPLQEDAIAQDTIQKSETSYLHYASNDYKKLALRGKDNTIYNYREKRRFIKVWMGTEHEVDLLVLAFTKIAAYEERQNKDCSEFSTSEIFECYGLPTMPKSAGRLYEFNKVITKYALWYKEKNGFKENNYEYIEWNDFKVLFPRQNYIED
jgi:site-specific recombinase XerD